MGQFPERRVRGRQLSVRDLVRYGNWWRHGDTFRNILVEPKDVGALEWGNLGSSVWPK